MNKEFEVVEVPVDLQSVWDKVKPIRQHLVCWKKGVEMYVEIFDGLSRVSAFPTYMDSEKDIRTHVGYRYSDLLYLLNKKLIKQTAKQLK